MRLPLARIGLGLFAGLTIAVAGCAADPVENPSRADPGLADPGLTLAASTETLEEESYRFEVTAGRLMSATGAVDPAAEAGTATISVESGPVAMDVETIVIGTEMWADLGELGGLLGVETEWVHLDQTRLGEAGFAGVAPGELDLVGAAELLRGLGTVEQVDEHTLRGTIEVTRGESSALADQLLAELGEESVTVDFVATVDDQQRLTGLVIEFPRNADLPAERLELRYFDFGTPVEVSPPPADQVTELPEALYDVFS